MTTSSTAFGTSKHSPTPKVYLQPLSSGTSLFFMGNNCQVTLHPDDVLVAQEIVRRVNGWEKHLAMFKDIRELFRFGVAHDSRTPEEMQDTIRNIADIVNEALTEAGEKC